MLLGLYPPSCREAGHLGLFDWHLREFFGAELTPILVRDLAQETIIPNADGRCTQYDVMFRAASQRVEAEANHFRSLAGRLRSALQLPLGSPVRVSDFIDIGTCHMLYRLPVPTQATQELLHAAMEFNGEKWAVMFSDPQLLKLTVGRLLAEIIASFLEVRDGETWPRLRILAGHDSTLIPLLCALDIFDGAWPPYASSLVLELAEGPYGSWFVRAIANDEERPLLGQEYSPWIPLEKFEARLRESGALLSEDEYARLCLSGGRVA